MFKKAKVAEIFCSYCFQELTSALKCTHHFPCGGRGILLQVQGVSNRFSTWQQAVLCQKEREKIRRCCCSNAAAITPDEQPPRIVEVAAHDFAASVSPADADVELPFRDIQDFGQCEISEDPIDISSSESSSSDDLELDPTELTESGEAATPSMDLQLSQVLREWNPENYYPLNNKMEVISFFLWEALGISRREADVFLIPVLRSLVSSDTRIRNQRSLISAIFDNSLQYEVSAFFLISKKFEIYETFVFQKFQERRLEDKFLLEVFHALYPNVAQPVLIWRDALDVLVSLFVNLSFSDFDLLPRTVTHSVHGRLLFGLVDGNQFHSHRETTSGYGGAVIPISVGTRHAEIIFSFLDLLFPFSLQSGAKTRERSAFERLYLIICAMDNGYLLFTIQFHPVRLTLGNISDPQLRQRQGSAVVAMIPCTPKKTDGYSHTDEASIHSLIISDSINIIFEKWLRCVSVHLYVFDALLRPRTQSPVLVTDKNGEQRLVRFFLTAVWILLSPFTEIIEQIVVDGEESMHMQSAMPNSLLPCKTKTCVPGSVPLRDHFHHSKFDSTPFTIVVRGGAVVVVENKAKPRDYAAHNKLVQDARSNGATAQKSRDKIQLMRMYPAMVHNFFFLPSSSEFVLSFEGRIR